MTPYATRTPPPTVDAQLRRLAEVWPVGARVTHTGTATVGTVTAAADPPGPSIGRRGAWCLVGGRPAVCVQWASGDGTSWTAWTRPAVLHRTDTPAPRRIRPARPRPSTR